MNQNGGLPEPVCMNFQGLSFFKWSFLLSHQQDNYFLFGDSEVQPYIKHLLASCLLISLSPTLELTWEETLPVLEYHEVFAFWWDHQNNSLAVSFLAPFMYVNYTNPIHKTLRVLLWHQGQTTKSRMSLATSILGVKEVLHAQFPECSTQVDPPDLKLCEPHRYLI